MGVNITNAQTELADSLTTEIKKCRVDSTKLRLILDLAWELESMNPDSSLVLAFEALKIAEKYKSPDLLSDTYNSLGSVYSNLGEFQKSLDNYFRSAKICAAMKDSSSLSIAFNNISSVYHVVGNYSKALEFGFNSLLIAEKFKSASLLESAYQTLASIFHDQGKTDISLEYYKKSLKLALENNDQTSCAVCYNNMGLIYMDQKNYVLAEEYYYKAQKIHYQLNDLLGQSIVLSNLGDIAVAKKNYDTGLGCYNDALKISIEINDAEGVVVNNLSIGALYAQRGMYSKALPFLTLGLKVGKERGLRRELAKGYLTISDVYEHLKRPTEALQFFKLYNTLFDSIESDKKSRSFVELQAISESEKRQKEIELLNKDKKIKDVDLKNQKIISFAVVTGLVLMLMLALVLIKQNKLKQRANEALTVKNEEIENQKLEITAQHQALEKNHLFIEKQNLLISEKNKNVTDSIKYAQRIQEALFPPDNLVKSLLPDSFTFFKPRDIVSGDFYWVEKVDETVYVGVFDCTGHGVPGAFMSIVGFNLLKHAIFEHKCKLPSEILGHVHKDLSDTLRQKEGFTNVKDGMDAALCSISKNSSTLNFAGANNALYLVKSENNTRTLLEIKGDKQAIGGYVDEEIKPFTNQQIQLQKGDILYISTDGFADQFGGQDRKKLMKNNFKKLLLEISSNSLDVQKQLLENYFDSWKGDFKQIDDVLVVGIKI